MSEFIAVLKQCRRLIVCAFLISAVLPLCGRAQGSNLLDLKTQIESLYTVLPIQNGVVLLPKDTNKTVSVELTGNTIAVNGDQVTGNELRSRLGADADLILRLSYLTPSKRQSLFSVDGNRNRFERQSPPRRGTHRNDVARFGGDVTVNRGEVVDGNVAVFGGNARIDGQVDGNVAVFGGRLDLGPEADVTGDVAVIGGTLMREPGSNIGGHVAEMGWGGMFANIPGNRRFTWTGMPPVFTTASTLARLGVLVLFGCIVMLLGGSVANRIGDRAAAEPVRAGLTGLLGELLFFPALIMTILLLVISILGIPLLFLLPFAVLAVAVIFLVGFTGVAVRVGRLIGSRLGWTMGPYVTTIVGIVAVLLPIVLARLLGLAGLNVIGVPLLVAGVLIEYLAWTIGFGAAALTYLRPGNAGVATPQA